MLKLPFVLLYTAMTFLAWGVYGILLHNGQEAMNHSYLRPFVGVGIAYFLIAVLGAGTVLGNGKEKGHWSVSGTILSFLAGSVGALGALGVILALAFGGKPIFVMPLVFGGAPVVNTLVTSWISKTFHKITPLFVIGMVMVGVGMIGVLRYKPQKPSPSASSTKVETTNVETTIQTDRILLDHARFKYISTASDQSKASETSSDLKKNDEKVGGFVNVFLSILLAVVCWGAYGPVLHLGQMRMGGSRLRPFVCVGLAYFVIAVAAPISLLSIDQGNFDFTGMLWSIAAGTAGAIGALGIILAFNSGGKPVFVMPLVFGFAPVVNTILAMWIANQLEKIGLEFAASLATVIGGAVMVLVFAPKAAHGPPAKESHRPGPTPPVDKLPEPLPPPTPSDASNSDSNARAESSMKSDQASPNKEASS